MLQQAFERIMKEYSTARTQTFAQHRLADFIRNDVPYYLQTTLSSSPLIWKASAGQGQWADAPWIAGLHPVVTETPMNGYYVVFLFDRSLTRLYLSLNQGMTALKSEFGVQAKSILDHRARIIRQRIPEAASRFIDDPIQLNPSASSDRLAMYEPGHAFGKMYLKNRIPDTESLLRDLREMIRLYELAIYKGGYSEFDVFEDRVEDDQDEKSSQMSLEEQRKYRLHKSIERNSKLVQEAKKTHGYVCQVCGFDFEKQYGAIGKQFIEAHHKTPLASLQENAKVLLSPKDDFAVVCSNCHRMIHREGAPSTFAEFVERYKRLHQRR